MLAHRKIRSYLVIIASLVVIIIASACDSQYVRRATKEENLTVEDKRDRRGGKIGREGKPDDKDRVLLSFGKKKKASNNEQNSLGAASRNTNIYLWQGALETIDFMPLISSDFVGGIILTDWYTPPENQNQRYKLTVRIIGPVFRSDALSVKIFSQRLQGNSWRNEEPDENTAKIIEDTMLTRARDLIADAKL